jgi:hemolysin activation/secretion protein
VSLDKLDKAALLLAEVPGVQTNLSLQPGAQAGETQAVVTVAEGKAVEGNVGLDNAGGRVTGEQRVTAKVTLNNPLKIGDAVGVQAMHSQGADYQRLNYSAPVGDAGWRAGVNTSAMKYKLISDEYKGLEARGPSSSSGVDLTIPLVRTREQSTSLQLAYDKKSFRNETAVQTVSNYQANAMSAYLENTVVDPQRGRETTVSAQWVNGHVDLSGSPNQADDAAGPQTAGQYNKVKLAAAFKQNLDARNTWVASGQAQLANKNLDGSEKMYLGGMQGVRAYPTNEAGGSAGSLFSLEWQRHLMAEQQRLTLAGFYDHGQVTVNKNNNFVGAASPNKYSLSGYGLWLGGNEPSAQGLTTWRLVWSRRIGANPAANITTGADQDGSKVRDRWRFTINYAF